MSSPKFVIGQRVGILVGVQAKGGPHVDRYGTVIDVVETWRDVFEYVVREDDGTELIYVGYLLVSVPPARDLSDFFVKANYGREDARDAVTPILLAPLWRNGTIVAEVPARIVGVLSRSQGAYFVEYLHEPGETYAAFGYRMRLV